MQPLAERRCQHPVLASVEQQVEHEGAVQLAFGHEGERAGAEALAEHPSFPQTAECGRCGSEPLRDLVVVRGEDRDDEMAPRYRDCCVNVTMPNA
jgi:hypothetical protein